MDIEPGTVLGGRYEVIRLLGQGGMGSVYEVRHTGTRKRMALKVITADVTQHPGLVARFEVEARASGQIESQHIAQVFDVGSDEALKTPYMAMEFLDGEDLEALLHRLGPLPPELALRIVTQACTGLERAHAHDIVHRDIKPANIYVARRDGDEIVIKLLDFGIAKIMQDEEQDGPGLTRTGAIIGSPLYMSPEQARGRRGGIDARTDVWSLGTVLYQILCGRTPHHDQEAMGDLIIAICSDAAVSVQKFAPWIPPDIDRIIQKALQIDVEKRYQSAGEMLADLKALLPNGSNLDQGMLTALDEEARSVVAPRGDGQDTEADGDLPRKLDTGPGSAGTTMDRKLAKADDAAGIAATALSPGQPNPLGATAGGARATTGIPSQTTGALASDAVAPRSGTSPLLLGGAAVALVAGVAAAFAIFSGGSTTQGGPSASAAPSEGASASAPASAEPPGGSGATPTAEPEVLPSEPAASASAPPEPPPGAGPPATGAAGRPTAPPGGKPIGGPRPPTTQAVPTAPPTSPPTAPPPPTTPPKRNPLDVNLK